MSTIKNVNTMNPKGIILSEFVKKPHLKCSWEKVGEYQIKMVWGYDTKPEFDGWYVYSEPCHECYNDPLQSGTGLYRYLKSFQPRLYDLELDPFFKAFGLINGTYYKNLCKESILEAKELLAELNQERDTLVKECKDLFEEREILEGKYSVNRQMRELKEEKIRRLDEKIDCLQKEIYPIKVFRIKPIKEDLLEIVLHSEDGFRKVGTLSFQDEIVKRKLDIEKHQFYRAYISLCRTQICWEGDRQYINTSDLLVCLQ